LPVTVNLPELARSLITTAVGDILGATLSALGATAEDAAAAVSAVEALFSEVLHGNVAEAANAATRAAAMLAVTEALDAEKPKA
jgi:hypothetical protein